MRAVVLTIFMSALLLLPNEGQAQVLVLTASGVITSTSGYDSSVQIGTPFTVSYSIDLVSSGTIVSSPGVGSFEASGSPNDTASVLFGDYAYNFDDLAGGIYSGVQGLYGYSFEIAGSDAASNPENFQSYLYLLSTTTPAVAPNTQLGSIQTFPITDFNDYSTFSFDGPSDSSPPTSPELGGSVTSYSVVTRAAPEPPTLTTMLIGLILLSSGVFCRRVYFIPSPRYNSLLQTLNKSG